MKRTRRNHASCCAVFMTTSHSVGIATPLSNCSTIRRPDIADVLDAVARRQETVVVPSLSRERPHGRHGNEPVS